MANVFALMMLLQFIFSVLGVQLFAMVQLQQTFNPHANFQSFGISLLSLLRYQTGENWNNVMTDIAIPKMITNQCDENPTYESIMANGGQPNGCGTSISYIYFILFQIIVNFIFLNLFIAVILNGFSNSNEEEGFEIFKSNIGVFKKLWQKYDPDATGFISVNDMESLILDLEQHSEFITEHVKDDPTSLRLFIA